VEEDVDDYICNGVAPHAYWHITYETTVLMYAYAVPLCILPIYFMTSCVHIQ